MQSNTVETESSFLVVGLIFILLFYGILFILYLLPFLFNLYILFIKAKKNGWSAFVPIWSNFTYGVISKRSKNIVWLYIFVLIIYYTLVVLNNVIGFSALSGGALSSVVDIFSNIVFFISFGLGIYIFIGFIKQYKINQIPSLLYWFLFIFIPIVALFWTSKAQHIEEDSSLSHNNISGVPVQVNNQEPSSNQPNIVPTSHSTAINNGNVTGLQQNVNAPVTDTFSQPSNVGPFDNAVTQPINQPNSASFTNNSQPIVQPDYSNIVSNANSIISPQSENSNIVAESPVVKIRVEPSYADNIVQNGSEQVLNQQVTQPQPTQPPSPKELNVPGDINSNK